MESIRSKIGGVIRESRTQQHITQEKLAERAGLSTGMIGQIERGESMPSVETLDVLIKELDIDPRGLFCNSPVPNDELIELHCVISSVDSSQQHTLLKIARALRDD